MEKLFVGAVKDHSQFFSSVFTEDEQKTQFPFPWFSEGHHDRILWETADRAKDEAIAVLEKVNLHKTYNIVRTN